MKTDNRKPKANIVTQRRYSYLHEISKGPSEAIDSHHIFVLRNDFRFLVFGAYGLLFSIMFSLFLILLKNKMTAVVLCIFTLAGFILIHQRNQVKKESVIIFPSFGVQLETVYRSGRTVRQFVPIGKILKPVLNECVTPITCYWSLSLILRGEEELLLVFKNLYPPVTMLVPIWRALLAATDEENQTDEDMAGG